MSNRVLFNISHAKRHMSEEDAREMINFLNNRLRRTLKSVVLKRGNQNKTSFCFRSNIMHFEIDKCILLIENIKKQCLADDEIFGYEHYLFALYRINDDIEQFNDKIPDTSDVWDVSMVNMRKYPAWGGKSAKQKEEQNIKRKDFVEKFKDVWSKI